ncbi:MAG: (5-formylfuran-3-yl)methyl phosphate synthase [Gammaproteobacteria bacterium]
MTALLASVNNLHEAVIALEAGVDIIDLKEPANGALGAVADPLIRRIAGNIRGRVPLSATTGDLPLEAERIALAVEQKAATGVDYVKVGLPEGGDLAGTLLRLHRIATQGVRLVGVLFADQGIDIGVLPKLSAAGFAGAMLDTAGKKAGGLRRHADDQVLNAFVRRCRSLGLLSGLAGSLDTADIAPLLKLSPDLLGFRGALCRSGLRTAALDPQALAAIRARIPRGEPAADQAPIQAMR